MDDNDADQRMKDALAAATSSEHPVTKTELNLPVGDVKFLAIQQFKPTSYNVHCMNANKESLSATGTVTELQNGNMFMYIFGGEEVNDPLIQCCAELVESIHAIQAKRNQAQV